MRVPVFSPGAFTADNLDLPLTVPRVDPGGQKSALGIDEVRSQIQIDREGYGTIVGMFLVNSKRKSPGERGPGFLHQAVLGGRRRYT